MSSNSNYIWVRFRGERFSWLTEGPAGSGPLTMERDCDEDGRPTSIVQLITGNSYAHVFPDGSIKRFGEVIGHRDELESEQAGWQPMSLLVEVSEEK